MKTVLLLGGFGFIGTNILKYMDSVGGNYRFIVFDRFPKHLDNLSFDCIYKIYSGDFADEYLLNQIFSENTIDLVLHSLSASVPSSSADNIFDLKFNVIPTVNLLNIMRMNNVKDIVFISSGGAVYGEETITKGGHNEDDVLYPKSAYGVSKLVIEKFLYLYSSLYSINSLVLRLSNPYGPFHYSKKQGIVNIALEKAMNNETIDIWGDGNGRKDYIYIVDFCRILFSLIEKNFQKFNVINVGSGQLLSVNDIVSTIKNKMYNSFEWNYIETNKLDVSSFELNIQKLMTEMPNIHFTNFEDGLAETHKWYAEK